MSIEEHLDELDYAVRQFEVEWRRFFGGAIDAPPDVLDKSLSTRIRNLYTTLGTSTADRFRLRGLEARFNALREHYGRALRDQELSGRAPAATTPTTPQAVVVDGTTPLEHTGHLYQTLFGDKHKPIEHEAFHRFLLKEAQRIRTRTRCDSVVYFLHREGDRYKLRARTINKSEQ